MDARLGLAVYALLGACLHVPPVIDEDSALSTTPPGATAGPVAELPQRPKPAAPITPSTNAQLPAAQCPVATGRRQFCEGRKICTRDERGCEKCVCNTELDSDRARFEQMDPWDMRQR